MPKWTIAIILVLIVIVAGFFIQKGVRTERGLIIETDKDSYDPSENLKLIIKNDFATSVGFSLCYPYLLEKDNGDGQWENYHYTDCQKFNGNGYNIVKFSSKSFELTLPNVSNGKHRLQIPACVGCREGDVFRADILFYSNEFQIKSE